MPLKAGAAALEAMRTVPGSAIVKYREFRSLDRMGVSKRHTEPLSLGGRANGSMTSFTRVGRGSATPHLIRIFLSILVGSCSSPLAVNAIDGRTPDGPVDGAIGEGGDPADLPDASIEVNGEAECVGADKQGLGSSGASWTAPERIVGGLTALFEPSLAAYGNDLVMVWSGEIYGPLMMMMRGANRRWTAPETIDERSHAWPFIVTDPNGVATVTFGRVGGERKPAVAARRVWTMRGRPGLGWEEQIRIDIETRPPTRQQATDAKYWHAAVGHDGTVAVSWQQPDGDRVRVWANVYRPGLGWGTALPVDAEDQVSPLTSDQHPRVAVDGFGRVTVAWYVRSGVASGVWANRFDGPSGWGEAARISEHGTYPGVVATSDGTVLVVWRGEAPHIRRYMPHSGWQEPEPVSSPAADEIVLVVDRTGALMVVLRESNGVRSRLWATRRPAGCGWSPAVGIGPDDGAHHHSARVVLDADGNATVAWHRTLADKSTIWVNRYLRGSGWGSPRQLSEDGAHAERPDVILDGGTNVTVLWSQLDAPPQDPDRPFAAWASRLESNQSR